MKADILATEAYKYTAELREIAAQRGAYHLTITSTWLGARNPQHEQVAFRATFDRIGLVALANLIHAMLQP